MAGDQAEWKSALSALDRYEAVRNIQQSLGPLRPAGEAVDVEQAIYDVSESREDYDAACAAKCRQLSSPQPDLCPPITTASSTINQPQDTDPNESGIRIGPFNNCTPIGDGVTSSVYRAGDSALKVITAPRITEPHNPSREAAILARIRPPCIPLLDVFRDQEKRLVLRFPYMPLTLADVFARDDGDGDGCPRAHQLRPVFVDVLRALDYLHSEHGLVHRDVKPSAVLLASPTGPARLADFGTAWHPQLSSATEPSDAKILDIGTGPYRAPEVLFGHAAYGPPIDMWAFGVMLAEALVRPPTPPFESRPAHEDGSQLGLILSIFKTLGTPTPSTWPEARAFKVSPFELWTVFPPRSWMDILPDADPGFRDVVAACLRYDGGRATAKAVCALSTEAPFGWFWGSGGVLTLLTWIIGPRVSVLFY